MASLKFPFVMTIAGSDCSGGAGIQADLKVFTALGCYGTSALTALTAQNTKGVQSVHAPPPDFVEQQIIAVLDDAEMDAIKTGMLYDSANTHAVASTLRSYYDRVNGRRKPPIVVDPVCVSTSGHTLLETSAIQVMVDELFPLATLITPNKAEAELLLSLPGEKVSIDSLLDAVNASKKLGKDCGSAILLKGGHLLATRSDIDNLLQGAAGRNVEWDRPYDDNMEILRTSERREEALVIDILFDPQNDSCTLFSRPRIESNSTHGTGCTLSAALACYLTRGHTLREATKLATAYTHLGIEAAFSFGHGHGPLNHLHSLSARFVPSPSTHDPYPFTRALIRSDATVWKQYVEHPFVRQLGEGTLSRDSFLHFIKQDYQYLKYYARAYGLLSAKASSFSIISSSARTIQNVLNEITMHKAYCATWGVNELELEKTQESAATTAYGAYLLDVGLHGDETKLVVALAACLLGYGEVGLWLTAEAAKENTWVKLEGNPYLKWIEDYSGDRYQSAVKLGLSMIEGRASDDPPSENRFNEWKAVWAKCTQLEKNFWDMAMNLS